MKEELEKKLYGYLLIFIDAFVNGLVIFTVILGSHLMYLNSINGTVTPALISAFAMGILRFAVKMKEHDDIDFDGLVSLPQDPDTGDSSKCSEDFFCFRDLFNFV